MTEQAEMSDSEKTHGNLLKKLNKQSKQQLLLSFLYMIDRPVFFEELEALLGAEDFEINVLPLLEHLREDLRSRDAPYNVNIDSESHSVSISLENSVLKKIEFSDYIFPKKYVLDRDKTKILVLIAFKTIIKHSEITLDEIIQKLGVTSLGLVTELERDGLVSQRMQERGEKVIHFRLTDHFLDIMGFPNDPFELSEFLRESFMQYFASDEDEEEITN